MAPPSPKARHQSLPPMLRKSNQNSKLGYSKAPRGLSVLMQENRVFTVTSISPSLSPRQRFYRYAFRAGRNLPDKEFRYLRTVIVTAAVHWRFGSVLDIISNLPLTFQHWAGISPHTSPCGLAETCVFVKQSQKPSICDPDKSGRPIFRSYGTILPSSLERVISRALACSACPPVSVCSTITFGNTAGFSRQRGVDHFIPTYAGTRTFVTAIQ